jgi:hypothetical protein
LSGSPCGPPAPPYYDQAVSPFWFWMQALIVVFVLAGIVIATINLV